MAFVKHLHTTRGVPHLDQSASPQSETSDAAPAPDAARPSPTAHLDIAEDTYEPCDCGRVVYGGSQQPKSHAEYTPTPNCFWCKGSGYKIAKRIMRPPQRLAPNDHAALSLVKGTATELKAAADALEQAAELLKNIAGHSRQAGMMHQASLRASRAAEGLVAQ